MPTAEDNLAVGSTGKIIVKTASDFLDQDTTCVSKKPVSSSATCGKKATPISQAQQQAESTTGSAGESAVAKTIERLKKSKMQSSTNMTYLQQNWNPSLQNLLHVHLLELKNLLVEYAIIKATKPINLVT